MDAQTVAAILAVVSALASVAASVLSARAARVGVRVGWEKALYFWPLVTIAPLAIFVFVWSPATGGLPAPDFYRVAAEVIPLLLVALMVEQALVSRLPKWASIEFVSVLLAGEIAAFVAVAGIFTDPSDETLVGGTFGATGLLATFTGAGLLAGAVLVGAAVLLRASES